MNRYNRFRNQYQHQMNNQRNNMQKMSNSPTPNSMANMNNNGNNLSPVKLKDYGPNPFVVDIDKVADANNNFRLALWTGQNLQVVLMSIKVGEEIGLEVHPDVDQFIYIEEGEGIVKMGMSKDKMDYQQKVDDDFAIMVPAGKWHNIINVGDEPLKLFTIYAPPEHPFGTVVEDKNQM